jgi:hypothetical protein
LGKGKVGTADDMGLIPGLLRGMWQVRYREEDCTGSRFFIHCYSPSSYRIVFPKLSTLENKTSTEKSFKRKKFLRIVKILKMALT